MNLVQRELRIRTAQPGDVDVLVSWWNDGAVMAHAGFPNGLGITHERVNKQLTENREGVRELLILEDGGVPIGEMNYRAGTSGTAEIGIKICDAAKQNAGRGRRYLTMLLLELFRMGFQKIRLDTDLGNRRAQHVYELLGFRKIGIRYDSWTDQLGNLRSAVDYELLPGELNRFD